MLNAPTSPVRTRGIRYALGAAFIFGASSPVSKHLLGSLNPIFFAGLLYLGCGVGLSALRLFRQGILGHPAPDNPIAGRQWIWMSASVLAGGIAAPVLLMLGLNQTSSATGSLLLNFEGVFTALLAWVIFRESFHLRILFGLLVMFLGSALLSWSPGETSGSAWGISAIVAACLGWAIDNNCTRRIASADSLQIVELKGWIAGGITTALGAWLSVRIGPWSDVAIAVALGFVCYGLSMVCMVRALRDLGAARTGIYFSTAPFIGVAASILFLHDRTTLSFWLAGGLMAVGVWLVSVQDVRRGPAGQTPES